MIEMTRRDKLIAVGLVGAAAVGYLLLAGVLLGLTAWFYYG